jgi:hypothetical protein
LIVPSSNPFFLTIPKELWIGSGGLADAASIRNRIVFRKNPITRMQFIR